MARVTGEVYVINFTRLFCSLISERAKGAEKESRGEMVVQKGVFGEPISLLPP